VPAADNVNCTVIASVVELVVVDVISGGGDFSTKLATSIPTFETLLREAQTELVQGAII
jgi:hypothetical protein